MDYFQTPESEPKTTNTLTGSMEDKHNRKHSKNQSLYNVLEVNKK